MYHFDGFDLKVQAAVCSGGELKVGLCNDCTVFHSDKDATGDKKTTSIVGVWKQEGMKEKVRTKATITHNLQLCHFFSSSSFFFALSLLGDSCSTLAIPWWF